MLSLPRRIAEPLASAVGAFALGCGIVAYSLQRQAFPDFEVFWTAARHAFDPLLYDAAHLTAAQSWMPGEGQRPFVYPPTFLLLIWPFGLPPFAVAFYLWVGLSCAAFVLAARLIVKPAAAAAILPLCIPVALAAGYGQSVLFAGAAFVGGTALIARRPLIAGILLGAAACIKPQLMLLSPLLLIGAWRALLAAVAAGWALIAASLVFGVERWPQWIVALPRFSDTVHQMPLKFINLLSPGLSAPEKLLIAAVGVAFALWTLRRGASERIVGVVCGSLCCTLYAVRADLAILAPSSLAWIIGDWKTGEWAIGGWLRRLAGLALIAGLIDSPIGVALLMLATMIAGLVREPRPAPERSEPFARFPDDENPPRRATSQSPPGKRRRADD